MNNLMALLRSTDTSAQTWYPTREPLPIHSPIKNQQATCRKKTDSVQYPSHSLQFSDLSDNHCVDGNLGHACLSPFKSQSVSHQTGGPFHNLNSRKYSEIFWNTLREWFHHTWPSSPGDGGVSSTFAYLVKVFRRGWENLRKLPGALAIKFRAMAYLKRREDFDLWSDQAIS